MVQMAKKRMRDEGQLMIGCSGAGEQLAWHYHGTAAMAQKTRDCCYRKKFPVLPISFPDAPIFSLFRCLGNSTIKTLEIWKFSLCK